MVLYLVNKCVLVAIIIVFTTGSLLNRYWSTSFQSPVIGRLDMNQSHNEIPRKIWQVDPWGFKLINGNWLQTWITKNAGYAYTLMSPESAEMFVCDKFRHNPRLVKTYRSLQSPSLKSDLLRFLILLAEGGIYSDLDTEAVRRAEDWVPRVAQGRARAIVGIEYDQLDSPKMAPGMYVPVQFCQWTVAGAQGHPLFQLMVDSMIQGIENLAKENRCSVGELEPSEEDVLRTTGPCKVDGDCLRLPVIARQRTCGRPPFQKLAITTPVR